ncbi:hypothetical protein [Photobacterium damselae]
MRNHTFHGGLSRISQAGLHIAIPSCQCQLVNVLHDDEGNQRQCSSDEL